MDPAPLSLRSTMRRVQNPLWSVAAVFILVAGIREAKEVLVPLLCAATLAIICSPVVRWLRARRVPNLLAVLAVVFAIMALIATLGALVGVSVSGFKENFGEYSQKLKTTARAASIWLTAHGVPFRADQWLGPEQLREAAERGANFMLRSVSQLSGAISNTFLVVVTMILILLEGSTIPAKLRAISGDPEADISHFQRMAKEVQAYLAIKSVLSVATGVLIATWAAVLHVDYAALWGLLAFLLNYIPNIGSLLAAVPAMVLALIQHGVGTCLGLGAGYLAVNMVLGNVVEPWWMGRKLGLSTTVVFVSLVAWNWILGPVGMLLSVPLTMALKIMLENSRDGRWMAALLDAGPQPVAAAGLSIRPPPSTMASEPPDTQRAQTDRITSPSARPSTETNEPPSTRPSAGTVEPDDV